MKKLFILIIFLSLQKISFAQTNVVEKNTKITLGYKEIPINDWYKSFEKWLLKQQSSNVKYTPDEDLNKYSMKIIKPNLHLYPILLLSIDSNKDYFIRNISTNRIEHKSILHPNSK